MPSTAADNRRIRRPARRKRRYPRILICTPEVTELPPGMGNAANMVTAKGGGLGDISAGLIRHLHGDKRFRLHVVLPRFDRRIRDLARINARDIDLLVPLFHGKGVHLVNDSAFSHSQEVYSESEAHPRISRAMAYQRHIINQLLDDLRPDIVHCNDWMTGLIPAAARDKGIKSVFTLHNVFTELETPDNIDRAGIDVERFKQYVYYERFPDYRVDNWRSNRVDLTATGIYAADVVNTVSETFLAEVVDGVFEEIVPASIAHALRTQHAAGRAFGILNAPRDTVAPHVTRFAEQYTTDDFAEVKPRNKKAFQRDIGLDERPDAPLFFWPSRLYGQKGPELLLASVERFVVEHGCQFAVVAVGDPGIERAFRLLQLRHPGRVAFRRFREDLSELGKAGADFILMPSRYEPCGLPQMEGMRFGTLPVARLTGGLRDTVREMDVDAGAGNGFVFEGYAAAPLAAAMERAVGFVRLPPPVRDPEVRRVMREAMERFSLERTAARYVELYESLLGLGGA